MEKLLDELLTVSRLELGNIELNTEEININSFLEDCENEIKPYLEKEGFILEVNNNCQENDTVLLDTDRFERVIQNIISNSLKYAQKDVQGRIVLEAQSYEKSIILSVSDNGIGLESKNLSKIFDPFYREDKSRTRVKDGSGIGLAVCKQIVELHGGHIWATKNEEHGITILISLNKENIKDE